jgi:hypothetical protein
VTWLDRELVAGPYLALATSEADYRKAMRHLKVPREQWAPWLADDSLGCMHTLKNPSGSVCCVVCVRLGAQAPIEAAATLIHEAVHVWQAWCKYRHEWEPSAEFEASPARCSRPTPNNCPR